MKKQFNFLLPLFSLLFLVTVESCQSVVDSAQIKPSGAREGVSSSGDGPTTEALGQPSRSYKVRDLEFVHSGATIMASQSYYKVSRLTDQQLQESCTIPEDGDWVTVKNGTRILLNGNTRVYELRKRGYLDFYVPCDESPVRPDDNYGMYDM